MAPPSHLGKRVKLTQVKRPFIYGTTARKFHEKHNPKPPGTPEGHTHSWEVFVRGVDDTDITYWLKRVQFKLHESIPNHVRMVDSEPGRPFSVSETGWGEFDITLKLYYVAESGEKPQTIYHYLRLHPYGRTDDEKAAMTNEQGEVRSWNYDEQLFNEPYEAFFNLLTAGAHPKGHPSAGGVLPTLGGKAGAAAAAAAAAGGGGKGGKGKGKGRPPPPPLPQKPDRVDEAWERSAMIPFGARPEQPFSVQTEEMEIVKLKEAYARAASLAETVTASVAEKERQLLALKAENQAAAGTIANGTGKGKGQGKGQEGAGAGRQ